MIIAPPGLTLPGVVHRRIAVNDTNLHYVSAGDAGTPLLLVHGFPESWWAFRKLIPLLATRHRVVALDLRGFGDSDCAHDGYDSKVAAADLHGIVEALGLGPVHLSAQDISGAAAFRFATHHPEQLRSFTAIEMGLPGFGLESFADVAKGGVWHIGVMAATGVPDVLLTGRERTFLGEFMFPSMCATPGAVDDADVGEFARGYARPGGWRGAAGLYRSMLAEGAEITDIAHNEGLAMPLLAIGAGGGDFTAGTMKGASGGREVRSVLIAQTGHYAAMEAPGAVADAMLDFMATVDRGSPGLS